MMSGNCYSAALKYTFVKLANWTQERFDRAYNVLCPGTLCATMEEVEKFDRAVQEDRRARMDREKAQREAQQEKHPKAFLDRHYRTAQHKHGAAHRPVPRAAPMPKPGKVPSPGR
jgi:hypothetical protein